MIARDASADDAARWYLERRVAPIPVPFKSKKPVLTEWPALRLTRDTVSEHFNGGPLNVGMLLGDPSDGLVDVDEDCPEAVILGPRLLPETPCVFGRESTGAAHRLYRTHPSLPTTSFQDVEKRADDARAMLVEIRGTGAQTIVPPSVHPSGERILFLCEEFAPAEVDGGDLSRRVRLLAIACLLARHWPDEGARHQAALGASGLLLRAAVPVEDVMRVVTAAAQVGGDTESKARRADVLSTRDKLEAGAAVVGGGELAKALTGDGAAVVKRIKAWLGVHQSAEPRWRPPADRPEIDTGNLGLAEMSDAAWRALDLANDPPRVYRYGTALAWLAEDPAGRPQIEVLGQDHVRHHLAQVATFTRWTAAPGRAPQAKPAFPPKALAADLLAVPRHTLPRLVRLVRMPVFTAQGRLLTEPGYDAASGLYVAPPAGLTIPAIAEAPTLEDLAQARALLLNELLIDFPFVTAADRAHAVALLMTPLLRECVPGDVPLFVISKSTPRTGAGLLVKVVSIVQDGAPVAPRTVSRDEEEMRKRLTAFLLPSPALVLLDNLHGRLDSAALAAILTSGGVWRDRVLGHTQEAAVPVRTCFVVTGNNPALSGEIAGRSVLIRLDAKLEDPSTRTGFLHPQLEAWTSEHRGRLLAAALTLAQGWVAAGRPRDKTVVFGGFQEWAETLGGLMTLVGIPGFLANRYQLFQQADEDTASIKGFLADWLTLYGMTPVATKELLAVAKNHPLNISSKTDQGMLVRLGRLIGGIVDRRYTLGEDGGVAVRRVGNKPGGVAWRLIEGSEGGGSVGSGGSYPSSHARNGGREGDWDHPPNPPNPPSEPAPDWVDEDPR